MSAQLDRIHCSSNTIPVESLAVQAPSLSAKNIGTPKISSSSTQSEASAFIPGQAALEILDEVVLAIGANQYGALEKNFPGLLDRMTRICAVKLEKAYEYASIPMAQRVMDSLKGLGSASPVITAASVYYLPMNTAPMGQKLIALGPGGCGVFEQFSNRNKQDYYGWFPMPKVAEDNPIRIQYRM